MATFKPIAINRTGVNLPYAEGQFIVATQPFTNGAATYPVGVYVDMLGVRQQLTTEGPKGDKGDTGATGATGQNGQAATITIGQVTTGAPGSAAQVSNSGTEQNAVINFVIPTGAAGPRGQQGAGWFHTMAPSGVTVQISSLQPQLTPTVGDGIVFPNGEVRQVISVSGATITLGTVLFSFKGDPGIGNATLSNVDGDSTEDGFTQAAVKGVAQAKNYYNRRFYDSSVSNSNSIENIGRKTEIKRYTSSDVALYSRTYNNLVYYTVKKPENYIYFNSYGDAVICNKFPKIPYIGTWDNEQYIGTFVVQADSTLFLVGFAIGTTLEEAQKAIDGLVIQYELADKYQYTEQVIENQPIHIANQEECLYWHEEWKKGLNLLNNSVFNSIGANLNAQFKTENGRLYLSSLTNNNANKYDTIKVNLLPNSIYTVHITGYNGYYNDVIVYAKGTSSDIPLGNNGVYGIELGRAKDNITFTTTGETEYYILIELKDETTVGNYTYTDIMLVRGSHPYPYEPYNGKILRETDLSGIQLFPIDINPAETIGGDWEDLGTITTSSSTVLHAYRRLS